MHWLKQISPPLLLLIILLNDNGATLWMSSTLLVFPILASILSLLARLLSRDFDRTIRPVLTIFISLSIIVYSLHSYEIALKQAEQKYQQITQICEQKNECPRELDGWQSSKYGGSPHIWLGDRVKYRLTYSVGDNHASLYLYQSLGMVDNYSLADWPVEQIAEDNYN